MDNRFPNTANQLLAILLPTPSVVDDIDHRWMEIDIVENFSMG